MYGEGIRTEYDRIAGVEHLLRSCIQAASSGWYELRVPLRWRSAQRDGSPQGSQCRSPVCRARVTSCTMKANEYSAPTPAAIARPFWFAFQGLGRSAAVGA